MKRITIIPKNYPNPIICDYEFNDKLPITNVYYFLDGQNIFKDKEATFGRSLRVNKHLKKLDQGYLAVAIHSEKSDKGRFNMYSPYPLSNTYLNDFINDTSLYAKFIDDFINTIIPTFEHNLKVAKRYLITSSLACLTSLDLTIKYPTLFTSVALFSPAFFLADNDIYLSLENMKDIKLPKQYIFVGKKEFSDDIYDNLLYVNTATKFYDYLLRNKQKASLVINKNGHHNEATWERYFSRFLNMI